MVKRKVYKFLCAIVGVSVFRKLNQDFHLYESCTKLSVWDTKFLINLGILNCALILVLCVFRLLRWLIFGNALRSREISIIKEKFHYTLFEFIWGLVIYKNIDKGSLSIWNVCHYASLFCCLLILKSFHYLCDLRVVELQRIPRDYHLFMGIFLLMFTDLVILWKVKNDITSNSLFAIFGFETLNLFPLILLSIFQFHTKIQTLSTSPITGSSYSTIIMDLSLNLIRMCLFLMYTYIFNHNFTFPVHMIPSSYKCFRLLLTNARRLVRYKRNIIRFKRFDQIQRGVDCLNEVCFCLEELDGDVRKLSCEHGFHFECLKWWLVKSETCPICRDPVNLHVS